MSHTQALKANEARNNIFGERDDLVVRKFLISGGTGILRLPASDNLIGVTSKNIYILSECKVEKSDSPLPLTTKEIESLCSLATSLKAKPLIAKVYGSRVGFVDVNGDDVKSIV